MAQDSDSVPGALRMYTNDMFALNKHIVEALERQHGDDRFQTDQRVGSFVGDSLDAFRRNVNELQLHIDRFGAGTGKVVKEAVAGALGVAAGVYDKVRKDPVSRGLRDDYVALNHAAISYTMLHTTALAYGDEPLAQTAQSHLKTLTPLIMRVYEIIPYAVMTELQDEPDAPVHREAADVTLQQGREAWHQGS
jgi:ferritin-like metal-binding protein YciE